MKRHTLASAIAASLFSLSHSAAASALIEDSKATLDTRNFYFNQDNRSGDAAPSYGEEWGQGFVLNFQSGYTEGAVGVGFDAIAQLGIRLDSGGRTSKADRSRNPGNLFPLDSNGRAADEFSRIDFAAKARIANTELRYGALQPKLPVLTYNDGRLLPQTFRGAQISSGDIDKLKLTVGEIRQASGRASSDYDDLRIAGGSERVDRFRYAGGDYVLTENLTTSYYFAELKDYYRQHYLGAVHNLALGDGKLTTDLRYFDSNAHGANDDRRAGYGASGFNNNGEVDNQAASALFTFSQSGHSLGLGYQHLSGNSNFPFINNGDGATAYLITDSQIGKFQRAGERTWLARYGYDFAAAGVPGLKATASYLRGTDVDSAVAGADSEWERDLRVDYKVQSGYLKDLGISLRHASLRSAVPGQRDVDEVRAILSYSFVLR